MWRDLITDNLNEEGEYEKTVLVWTAFMFILLLIQPPSHGHGGT